ncbi:MAG TPA: DUF1579 domain-containing protein [Tepidisphaeraceae bacterium]|jgi:hypothetical protein|nr:DUF1579 domain-containing protein [Tepidisphaeraceae bacterium]
MRKTIIACLALAFVTIVAVRAADEQPKMPQPQKEHEWLKQLEGNWDLDIQVTEPNKETTKSKGTETTRMMGPFWAVSEVKASMMDMPFTGSLTLGYDAQAKKYVATWVDSMGDHLWKYEGTLEGGKTLTLETTGPCPMQGGKITRFKDVIEIKDKDHRTFSSWVDFDGKMVQMLTINYTRKAATASAN